MANNANILLHGLFFLQYQGNNLIVMAADHNMHVFLQRPQGGQKPFPSLPIDPSFNNLAPNTKQVAFPSNMPQFDKTETGVGDLVSIQMPKKNYRCRMVLPWPLDIVMIRAGGFIKDFQPDPASKVGQSILKHTGPGMGIVTLLHYETTDPEFTLSCFAEHMNPAPAPDVNMALRDAQILFTNGANFDLQLLDVKRPIICPDPEPLPPKIQNYRVNRDDEHSVGEVYKVEDCATILGTDPANCVQFGIMG